MTFKSKPKATAALILSLGTLLFLPPFILIFNKSTPVFGIPVSVLYLFGIWLLVIVLSALAARRLPDPRE